MIWFGLNVSRISLTSCNYMFGVQTCRHIKSPCAEDKVMLNEQQKTDWGIDRMRESVPRAAL